MTIQYDNLDTSISAVGSASNIPIVFRTKGTGALDLSAGSTGINISNGNTVTALTGTSAGTGYSSFPSVAISAPQIASGTQATASVARMFNNGATVQSGGTGYTNGDVLTVVGGTPVGSAATLTVTSVSGGVITGVSATNQASYTALPTNPVSVTGGTGLSATFNLTYGLVTGSTGLSITNAGSGYVEQPTVTFSGGGGSGAAAYATVGSGTVVRSIGSSMLFQTPGGTAFGVTDIANTVNYIRNQGASAGFQPFTTAQGTDTNIAYGFTSKGNGSLNLYTNLGNQLQFTVAHTASAVNYVQVTGAATTNRPTISTQGSDTNIGLLFAAKGTTGATVFLGSGGSTNQFVISNNGAGTNFLQTASAATANAPVLSAQGSDTNIDLALTPKGTGRVRFGTHTATADTAISGYIEILDSGGTVRKLAVIT